MNPTAAQKRRWSAIVETGCAVESIECQGRLTIHHCGTGGGGRKNHDKVICLCFRHHLGDVGIDGKKLSKRGWQDKYKSEDELLQRTERLLDE